MGKPELLETEHFASNNARVINHAELKPIIEEWLTDKTIDQTVDMLLEKGIPAAPINTIDRVVKDPHIAGAREMFVEIDHPMAGRLKITGNQIKLTNHKIDIRKLSPTLSQDTRQIMVERLGMSDKQVDELIAEEVV